MHLHVHVDENIRRNEAAVIQSTNDGAPQQCSKDVAVDVAADNDTAADGDDDVDDDGDYISIYRACFKKNSLLQISSAKFLNDPFYKNNFNLSKFPNNPFLVIYTCE